MALMNELRTKGLLNDERAEQLEAALINSRLIGAAIRIVMAKFKVNEAEAFEMLRVKRQNTNITLPVIADDLTRTGAVSDLVPLGPQAASSLTRLRAPTHPV